MELDLIEFYDNKIHLVISYNEESYRIEMEAGEFFGVLASAFWSGQAIKANKAEKE